jgi:GT2 family glycosyltransferase
VNVISVVIPATDAPPTLARCVAAVRACINPREELIVVETPGVTVPAEARNIGAGQATGDVLLFIDADVEVHSDVCERIRRVFEEDPELAAVFGSYDDDPEHNGLVSDFRNLLHHQVHQEGAGAATTFWSGLGAVRRDAFVAMSGFDERLRYLEDVDLGMRLSESGRRIRLDPAIQGKHLKRWTLANMVYTDVFGRGVPWVRLLAKSRSHSTTLNLGWRHRASSAGSILFFIGLIRPRPRLAAAAVLLLYALNGSFYTLLLRRRGWRQAAVGVPLHALHHVAGAAAVPVAGMLYLIERLGDLSRSAR